MTLIQPQFLLDRDRKKIILSEGKRLDVGDEKFGGARERLSFFANLQVKFDFANLKKSRCCRSF